MVAVIILILIFVSLAGFFSGMETGLISIDKFKLEKESKKEKNKKHLLRFLKTPDKFLGTTLIGTNISIVIVSSVFTAFFVKQKQFFSEEYAALLVAGFLLIFAEIIPKAVFRENANILVPKSYPILRFFYFILTPLISLVTLLNQGLTRLFGITDQDRFQSLTREDLSYILSETKEDPSLLPPQREMIEDALEFNELDAKNVMIPRTEMIALSHDMKLSEVIKIAKKEGFTRYPVYKDDLDHIIGILIIYDLLECKDLENKKAGDYLRKAYFAPETTDLPVLFKDMQKEKKSITIIVDSYGGTAGMLTVEDILEEIVGDIEDEYDYDEEDKEIEQINENHFVLKGFVEVDYLNDEYNLDLPDGDFETVAGMIIDKLAKIPSKGQKLKINSWNVEILQVTNRKIVKVKLTK